MPYIYKNGAVVEVSQAEHDKIMQQLQTNRPDLYDDVTSPGEGAVSGGGYTPGTTLFQYYVSDPAVAAMDDLAKSLSSFDPFAGVKNWFDSVNWPALLLPAGLILAGGLVVVKAVRS